MTDEVLEDDFVECPEASSGRLEDEIANTFVLLDAIADETRLQAASVEKTLTMRLAEVYVLYYYWGNSPHLDDFELDLNAYLEDREIPFNDGTSLALKFTKVFLADTNIAKASKYAKHMETAFNKGVEPLEYPEWTNLNGIEETSRRKPLLKGAKRIHRNSKSDYNRALDLIYRWLEIKESNPLYSSNVPVDDIKMKGNPRIEGNSAKTRYEITITKRYDDLKNPLMCEVDTLWILPRLDSIEQLIVHHLARAIMGKLEELEELVRVSDMKTFGTDIQELIEFDEYVAEWRIEQENILRRDLREAQSRGEDEGLVYANHNPVPPKLKKKKAQP